MTSQRIRTIITWTGAVALVVLLSGAIYGYFTFTNLTEEYRSRAEFLSWTFQDQVSFDLDRGEDHDLNNFVGQLAVGNVFYAQIITDSGITEKNLLNLSIPESTAPNSVLEIEHLRLDGHSIWDVKRRLAYANGYVRLGINLEPLESTIRMQLLILIGFGLALIAVTALVASLATSHSESRSDDLATSTSMSVSNGEMAPLNSEFSSIHSEPDRPPVLDVEIRSDEEHLSDATPTTNSSTAVTVGELMIDNASKRVEIRGEQLELSPKEFDLLYLLAQAPGKVFSNQEILDRVWTDSHMATAQDVKQYIYFVRQKVEEDPKQPSLIVTVRGFGYKLQD